MEKKGKSICNYLIKWNIVYNLYDYFLLYFFIQLVIKYFSMSVYSIKNKIFMMR